MASTKNATDGQVFAIKKFKPDKEGELVAYTGISQSAMREIAVSALDFGDDGHDYMLVNGRSSGGLVW